jgi:hypothetical protein
MMKAKMMEVAAKGWPDEKDAVVPAWPPACFS